MHTFPRIKPCLIVCVLLMASSVLQAGDEKAKIDAIVTPFLQDKPYSGLVVGITGPDGHQTFGYGEVLLEGKQQTPTGETIFEIGSITKLFTGTLLADQVLAGKMKLDDPVQKHLPEDLVVPRRDDRDITLLQLATQASSLPIQPPLIALFALTTKDPGNPYAEYDRKQLARTLSNMKLSYPIGSRYAYSNLGVGLLGHALSHAAEAESYEALLIDRVLDPLELTDTRIQLSEKQLERLVPGYDVRGRQSSPWTFATLESAGGLRSTTADLLTFADAALGRNDILAEAFKMAHQPWRVTRIKDRTLGLCWMHDRMENGTSILWHNGGTGGYRSFIAIVPDSKLGLVILSNSAHSVDALGDALLMSLTTRD